MTQGSWRIEDVTEAELAKLAAWTSLILKKGDTVHLNGDLGAGKTTFARALIRHLSENSIDEIPSPTFALLQHYETARVDIYHFDLYRLSDPDEAFEIGLDDAAINGVSLIEWPERLENHVGPDYLDIRLEEAQASEERHVTLTGHGMWRERIARLQQLVGFVEKSDWSAAYPLYMQGDASARGYARLTGLDRPAILMNAPDQPDGPPIRDGKPYSQIAHLAEDVRAFVGVANAMREAGFHAPEIYAHDLCDGFLILEDMGTRVFGSEISAGRPIIDLYQLAVDLLIEMRKHHVPPALKLPGGRSYHVPEFDQGAFLIEAELLIDWYWPALKPGAISDRQRHEYQTLYADLFARIASFDQGWFLRDFHSPNLIWLPKPDEGSAINHVGIIDFQDALRGPRSYDLVSLLQDARLDVPMSIEAELHAHYCKSALSQDPAFNEDQFRLSYAILGAQRNTKIIGIFARLAMRDGKTDYIKHMPRIWQYLERNLAHPELAPLKNWFDEHFPQSLRGSAIAQKIAK